MINFKKITEIFLDMKENDKDNYSLFFEHDFCGQSLMNRRDYIKNKFKKIKSFVDIDSFNFNNTILLFDDYILSNNYILPLANQCYSGSRSYDEKFVVSFEKLLDNKNIFDFSVKSLTTEEAFYLKLKEIIWHRNKIVL